jgi:hypothetical protein
LQRLRTNGRVDRAWRDSQPTITVRCGFCYVVCVLSPGQVHALPWLWREDASPVLFDETVYAGPCALNLHLGTATHHALCVCVCWLTTRRAGLLRGDLLEPFGCRYRGRKLRILFTVRLPCAVAPAASQADGLLARLGVGRDQQRGAADPQHDSRRARAPDGRQGASGVWFLGRALCLTEGQSMRNQTVFLTYHSHAAPNVLVAAWTGPVSELQMLFKRVVPVSVRPRLSSVSVCSCVSF